MTSCNYMLKALNDSVSFRISSDNEETVQQFFYTFLGLFPGVLDFESRKIQCFTVNSEQLRINLHEFVAEHQEYPMLNGIEAFVRKLEENEAFYVLPDFVPTQTESIKLANYLKAYKEGTNYEDLNQETETLFGDLLDSYHIAVYGEKRLTIGEKIKENKICRFCGKGYPTVIFNKKAHAISEALGNKTLVLTEECDDCNWKFSQSIEPDLVNYLAMYRTFYGIKGKGGFKDFKGKNFKFFKNENLELHFTEAPENREDDYGFPTAIRLESGRKVALQNIYKTLAKFVLSLIDKDQLVHFNRTVEWINGTLEIQELPKIAEFAFYDNLQEQPTLTVYTRQDPDPQYPYMVGEFHFIFMKYIFIIPACNNDVRTFTVPEEYEMFWRKFKHYDLLRDQAVFKDFSDTVERDFNITLNMRRSGKDNNEKPTE